MTVLRKLLTKLAVVVLLGGPTLSAAGISGVVIRASEDIAVPGYGRVFVVFSRESDPEPRFKPGEQVENADPFFGADVAGWDGGAMSLPGDAVGYPLARLEDLPDGEWYAQAVYDTNNVLSGINAPGNYYSDVVRVISGAGAAEIRLTLSRQEPEESLPGETTELKFVRIRSELLSEYYEEDVYIRAAVLLPRGYADSDASYPVAYHIGGLKARYTRALELLDDEAFMAFWNADEAPQMIMVFLDGESPYGDSYQVNSANSGPYGDANMRELFPALQQRFRMLDSADARFVSGCSTGGWVSLALQVFYPDYFNGVWSFSPDSPSFRAFQLVNLLEDENAFLNEYGYERPSMRETDGEPVFSVRQEIAMERALGAGDSFTLSGQQWGVWNAIFGPRAADGMPAPVWDQETGVIDGRIVAAWQAYDLNDYLKENWSTLGERLSGKIHVVMGDMDNFYLTEGARILERTLSELSSPAANAEFRYVPYHGHCEFGTQMYYIDVIEAMARAYEASVR
jgi:S-formylglutathione hydrolase FrmB